MQYPDSPHFPLNRSAVLHGMTLLKGSLVRGVWVRKARYVESGFERRLLQSDAGWGTPLRTCGRIWGFYYRAQFHITDLTSGSAVLLAIDYDKPPNVAVGVELESGPLRGAVEIEFPGTVSVLVSAGVRFWDDRRGAFRAAGERVRA